MSQPEPSDPYHGSSREPPKPAPGHEFLDGSHELEKRREQEQTRELTKGLDWIKFFKAFFSPNASTGLSASFVTPPSHEVMSVADTTYRIGLAQNSATKAFTSKVVSCFDKYTAPPYKGTVSDAVRAGVHSFTYYLTLSEQAQVDSHKLLLVQGDAIKVMSDVSAAGSVDTYRKPYDQLDDIHDQLAQRDKAFSVLSKLNISNGDAEMYSQWLSFPDAAFWKSVGESIKARPANLHSIEAMILLNSIGTGSPIAVKFIKQDKIQAVTDALLKVAKAQYEATKKKASKTQTNDDAYDTAMQDALYEVLLRVSYGVEDAVPDRELLPRQTMAEIVMDVYGQLRDAYPTPYQ